MSLFMKLFIYILLIIKIVYLYISFKYRFFDTKGTTTYMFDGAFHELIHKIFLFFMALFMVYLFHPRRTSIVIEGQVKFSYLYLRS